MKHNKDIRKRPIPLLVGLLLVLGSSACRKEITVVLPGDEADLALNFYAATEVMQAAYGPKTATVAVYIDKYQQQTKPLSSSSDTKFPTFTFGTSDGLEYPLSTNRNGINYVRYVAGGHRLMFTDTTNAVVLDTAINQPAQTYTCLYLTDKAAAANAPAAYKMVVVKEPRAEIPADKVGIRFIHLSPDAGTLVCSRRKADGSLTNALPADLHFGEASVYEYFTADDAVSGLIRFSLDNTANSISVPAGVPFMPGRSYAVLISGFQNDQQRQIAVGKKPDGSIKYSSVSIAGNLHTTLRITW